MNDKKRIRADFRMAVFTRDRFRCVMCGKPGHSPKDASAHKKFHANPVVVLDAHHITDRNKMPGGGYVKENGISLCEKCHLKAEQYHMVGSAPSGYAPNDLYAKIGSSFVKAYTASLKMLDWKQRK